MAKESLLADSLKDISLKSNVKKSLPPKQVTANNNTIIENSNKEFYETAIKNLESKLKEKETIIENHLASIENKDKLINQLRDEKSQTQNGVEAIDKAKLIDIASCIFNNFATSSDVSNLIVNRAKEGSLKEVISF